MIYTIEDIEKAKELKKQGYYYIAKDNDSNVTAFELLPCKDFTGIWVSSAAQFGFGTKRLGKNIFETISNQFPVRLDDIIASEKLKRLTEYDSKYFIPEDSADNGVVLLRSNFEEIVIPCVENSEICEKFNRLVELEDKIEKGELVFKENL